MVASEGGKLPIVVDTSPCLSQIKSQVSEPALKFALYEPVEFIRWGGRGEGHSKFGEGQKGMRAEGSVGQGRREGGSQSRTAGLYSPFALYKPAV